MVSCHFFRQTTSRVDKSSGALIIILGQETWVSSMSFPLGKHQELPGLGFLQIYSSNYIFPWFSHDIPMIIPWLSMIFPWFSHDFPMIIHDFPMIIHDFPMIWYGQNRSEAWDSKTPESFLMRRVSKNVGNPWPVLTYQIQMEWFHQHGVETKQNGHLPDVFVGVGSHCPSRTASRGWPIFSQFI